MIRQSHQGGVRFWAALILLSVATDLLLKDPPNPQQTLWSCYWAALAVALGIFVRSDLLVSSGLVFFAGLGLPAWVLGRLLQQDVDPTSVLIHIVPLVAGAMYVAALPGLPKHSGGIAWVLHAVPLELAWLFCDPSQNINLAHAPWPPVARFVLRLWQFHALLLAVSAVTLSVTAHIVNLLVVKRTRTADRNGETEKIYLPYMSRKVSGKGTGVRGADQEFPADR